MRRSILFFMVLALLSCSGGGGGGGGETPVVDRELPLVLVAGMVPLEPQADPDWIGAVDLGRVGVTQVEGAYDLTTPAGEALAFDVLSRGDSNSGPVRVSLAHVADGGSAPVGGVESLAEAGMVPSASGAGTHGPWFDARGDGFARLSVKGSVDRDHILVVQADTGGNAGAALVRLRIGPPSPINQLAGSGGDYPGVLEDRTLYSSNSWLFGLPTAAVSGDRTSIVCYEGDQVEPRAGARYEMRLQFDHGTGGVTGGGSEETSPDSGHWRDHEIAALFNVLAFVRSGGSEVTLRLSFDRGATIGQELVLGSAEPGFPSRLVQCAMASDYSLAALFWRSNADGSTELILVEGRPDDLDPSGSPRHYAFDPEVVLHRASGDCVPLLMSAAWSEGGDLVVGYGFSQFTVKPDLTWESLTQNRCAVRPYGGGFTDVLVEEDVIVGKDPSVALSGSGAGLRIFYAYEGRSGVVLRSSSDAGMTFSAGVAFGSPAAHTPMVLARSQAGGTRTDLLYLDMAEKGQELHVVHWDDYDGSVPPSWRLTEAKLVESSTLPPAAPSPGNPTGVFAPGAGFRITEVAWFGYDAVVDGDDVIVVYDEQTYDAYTYMLGAPAFRELDGALSPADGGFAATDPPPLAPGLTEPMPPPDPDHMHQLRLLRLD